MIAIEIIIFLRQVILQALRQYVSFCPALSCYDREWIFTERNGEVKIKLDGIKNGLHFVRKLSTACPFKGGYCDGIVNVRRKISDIYFEL